MLSVTCLAVLAVLMLASTCLRPDLGCRCQKLSPPPRIEFRLRLRQELEHTRTLGRGQLEEGSDVAPRDDQGVTGRDWKGIANHKGHVVREHDACCV